MSKSLENYPVALRRAQELFRDGVEKAAERAEQSAARADSEEKALALMRLINRVNSESFHYGHIRRIALPELMKSFEALGINNEHGLRFLETEYSIAEEEVVMEKEWIEKARAVVNRATFPGYTFAVVEGRSGVYVQGSYIEADATNPGKPEPQFTRKWVLTPEMTESEIVQTVFKLCMTSAEHRTREWFKYEGERVFSPHYDVRDLVNLCKLGRSDAGGRS